MLPLGQGWPPSQAAAYLLLILLMLLTSSWGTLGMFARRRVQALQIAWRYAAFNSRSAPARETRAFLLRICCSRCFCFYDKTRNAVITAAVPLWLPAQAE